jgi:hypothetical protein
VLANDTCESLFARALDHSLIQFYDVLYAIAMEGSIEPAGETWARPAISRAEFERWMTLTPDDSPDELRRKVRALRHSKFPGPFFAVDGLRFQLPPTPVE